MQGATPDIVVMAKSIGNGFPLAAVATTEDIAQAFAKKLHFNTYGGNPLACAVGSSVLDVIEEEKTQANCRRLGQYLTEELDKLRERYPDIVADVRGKGLLLGLEIGRHDRVSGSSVYNYIPLSKECKLILQKCAKRGLLVGKGGLHGNTIRIKPPMCWTLANATFCVQVLEECIHELQNELVS